MTATYVGLNPEKWNVRKWGRRWYVYEPFALNPAVAFRGWHAAVLYALHNAKPATQQAVVERVIARRVDESPW